MWSCDSIRQSCLQTRGTIYERELNALILWIFQRFWNSLWAHQKLLLETQSSSLVGLLVALPKAVQEFESWVHLKTFSSSSSRCWYQSRTLDKLCIFDVSCGKISIPLNFCICKIVESRYYPGKSMNAGKSSQLGKYNFRSLHNLIWACYHNDWIRTSCFDTDFASQNEVDKLTLIHCSVSY